MYKVSHENGWDIYGAFKVHNFYRRCVILSKGVGFLFTEIEFGWFS